MRIKWVILIIIATILESTMGGGIDFLFRTKDIIENRLVISPLEWAQTQIGILLGVMALLGVFTLGPFVKHKSRTRLEKIPYFQRR